MFWLLVSAAALAQDPAPGSVTLRVAVHRDAGTVHAIAADGAAGQCTVVGAALHCPAIGPVRFRYGPGGPWALVGDTELAPGTAGVAVVWAADREADRARIAPDVVTAEVVAELFVRSADREVLAPSGPLFADLLALIDHPDPAVRRALPDALLPYWRHTASDPFPADAPPVVPPGTIGRLAADPDPAVRRRLASRLRDLQVPGEPLMNEATAALLTLSAEGGRIQKAAFASLAVRARGGDAPAVDAWNAALQRVTTPGPPGRAAANTLAALAHQLEPGPGIDPSVAVQRTAVCQLERVWTAWRDDVPFDPALVERLLRETEGVSPELVRAWGRSDPAGLAAVIHRWEPSPPHSDRYGIVARALAESEDSALRSLAGDSLSPGSETPAAE
ncbi:MAG: hypothetical protein ABMA64_03785 [Myxococcota bacterium]